MTLETDLTTDRLHAGPSRSGGPAVVARRTVLGAACVGCAALVAACGSSGSSDGSSGSSPAPGSTGAAGPASLVALSDLKVGGSKAAKTPDGKKIIVVRTGETTAVAFDSTCTHQGCTVEPKGEELDCPCHGSRFRARDGSVLHGPATRPLADVAVTVVGDDVVMA